MLDELLGPLKLRLDGGTLIVTFDNPPVNALSDQVLADLERTLDYVLGNSELKVVVFTGVGKHFVAGLNINTLLDINEVAARNLAMRGQGLTQKIADLPIPTIAAVNGFALGGGSELALACDMCLASATAKFGFPEINLAVMPGFGGTQRAIRLLPSNIAYELIYTGDIINAEEAYRIGMINRVVDEGQVLEEALKLAKKIEAKSTYGIRGIKRVINMGSRVSLLEGLAIEMEELGKICAGPDVKEGVTAFFEKRKPNYSG